jgi:hypothetical protein
MRTYRSITNPHILLQHNSEEFVIENPVVSEEFLENNRSVFYCRAEFLFFGEKTTLLGASLTRAESIHMVNGALNKKISAEGRTNFLRNNCFVLVS